MSNDDKPKTKPLHVEHVLDEHDGRPHVTVAEDGIRHYAAGCPVLAAASREREAARAGGGPAKVANEAYRRGWDAVSWGAKGGTA